MISENMDRTELQQIMTQLDQALHNHQQWHNDLMRTLICRLPYDKHDAAPEAHKECRFGQWYYENTLPSIKKNPGFIAIGDAHKNMHQLARNILVTLHTSNSISSYDYDNFANSLERLKLEIYALKNELEAAFYDHDPLTMALNRVTLLPILREQQEMIKRKLSDSCCIAMMDLDSFKKINDTYGHIVGDKVLAAISRYVIEHLRPYDKLFRYGGEEFLLSMQQVNLSQAYDIIDRFRKEIANLSITIEPEKSINITVSFGISILDADSTVEQCIDQADKALYFAKDCGKNCTQLWSPNMKENKRY